MTHVVLDLKAGVVSLETDRERSWRIWSPPLHHVGALRWLNELTACGALLLAIGLWTNGGRATR